MKFNVLTLFPECFMDSKGNLVGPLGVGIISRSFIQKKWELELDDLKKYGSHLCRLDGKPAGGGPGMIFKPDKLSASLEKYKESNLYFLSPRGKKFDQEIARSMTKEKEITFFSGRYETIDQRLINYYNMKEISIGDYVLCGGEGAIQVIIEAVVRLLPGVMNNEESGVEESFSHILLEHDQYTQPRIWNGLAIPPVLLSGNHSEIQRWQRNNSIQITYSKRPDLYEDFTFLTLVLFLVRYFAGVTRVRKFMKSI